MRSGQTFADLPTLATHLRNQLESKQTVILYAYNGTGKTRLSMAFKDIGKLGGANTEARDTLYFNAFTEDLFHWDNDLEGDSDRKLTLNADSRFFAGLAELEMDNRIRPLLQRYADFDFRIDTQEWAVRFSRTVNGEVFDNIKVSRGEENIFVWCFFLAVMRLAMDPEIEAYRWVKYVYIDDPISSLDEHNAISVGNHLAQLLNKADNPLKVVISSHHPLFFNVMHNELDARKSKKVSAHFLSRSKTDGSYTLAYTGATPFFHHVAVLTDLYQAAQSDELYTYHFNMLRSVLEKSASFHGFSKFSDCIPTDDSDDPDGVLHARLINIMSHGDYSLFEPVPMGDENKGHFKTILNGFLSRYPFNPKLFPQPAPAAAPAGTP
ncbi:AAA family ATPase [Laribacter hongkongensis]|uniref:AAA family ATPase n=1 Tax=Laribacter hongkongensis TaxID=168471 RepID=UPI001EFCBFB7|nr:AAA family ATPase [Laribacter hongkongensis]MCG8991583.1 AAA family ATPase [Laribacter hongkongensis]MCG8996851.1 AAA family ATPase [Laribacter hongkongensis]MCG9001135.1 AAA family ATPase [Laribacter hongkongensis]MCG9003184.1 AAA family ATPase [Laribacter hongkongensis]MCG9007343.1 AAA family ATPase [Laribacter hongkongensis]